MPIAELNKPGELSWDQRLRRTAGRTKLTLNPEYQELKFTLHRKLLDKINLEALASIDNQKLRAEVRSALMSLLDGWHLWQLVGVVLAYAAVQTLEGFVITPRIVGHTVGLSEIWVLVALFVGGELFGFLGVLLAVPAAAVAKIFVAPAVRSYRGTALFRDAPPAIGSDGHLAGHDGLADAHPRES